jgi:hypothetical protein
MGQSMGCLPLRENRDTDVQANGPKWTEDSAEKLQEAVDRIFGGKIGETLLNLDFSFSIADPLLDGCPLIGCSSGFTKLCGYELPDIVGRNCRFLVDPVPADLIDTSMRRRTKDFCEAVRLRQEYRIPPEEREDWMPPGRPTDELFAMQKNARKDGTLFYNMFFMKALFLSSTLGRERPYIVALQSELMEGKADLARLAKNIEKLDTNMSKVMKELGGFFFTQTCISRQFNYAMPSPHDQITEAGKDDETLLAPTQLNSGFNCQEVQPWDSGRFTLVRKLADATRNGGVVRLMKNNAEEKLYAVKEMPNTWMRENHDEFVKAHPRETEMPWQDVGCTRFLNSVNFRFACALEGVYRTNEKTFVVSSFATEGDLFSAAEGGEAPGPAREAAFAPLVLDVFCAVQRLHEMQIAHRDISLENILRSKENGKIVIKVIDFGMASTGRMFKNCVRGKASYQAPEMQCDQPYDAFLSDAFATGVVVYSMLFKDYPWLSTKPGRCKCFEYVKNEGYRAYSKHRAVRGSSKRIKECSSDNLMLLLEGMLSIDPKRRLTLGEKQFAGERRSVWDEPWVKDAIQQVKQEQGYVSL